MLSDASDPVSGDADFSFNSWVTDGIQISWNTAPSTAIRIVAILIQCANAQVGEFTSSATQDTATTLTMSPSFAPETVFLSGNDSGQTSGTVTSSVNQSFGIADYNGSTITQASMGWSGGTEAAADGDPRSHVWDHYIREHISITEAIELVNFTSNSFDATSRDANQASKNMGYLALAWNDADRTVGVFDSPTGTATVDKSFTWPGFKPQCVIQAMSLCQAVDTKYTNADAGPQAIGAFDLEGGEECIGWASEDLAATINSESTHASNAIELSDDAGTAVFDANFANGSMDATGYTLEFTVIPSSTARKWVGFALQEFVAIITASESIGVAIVESEAVYGVGVVDESVGVGIVEGEVAYGLGVAGESFSLGGNDSRELPALVIVNVGL
jgi:hypothetical protein